MVPKLRFSFTSALSPYKLGVLTKWSSGGTPSKDNKSYWDGDISWFTAASMKDNVLSVSPTKISDLGLANGSRLANKNDILLLVRGSMLFNKIPVGVLLNDAAFNQDVKAIKCLEKFNHRFALQWFLSKESHLLSMVTGTGIGAGKLDTSELQSLDVYLPDYEEQSKIVAFLASADEKITLLNKQYDLLCQYKKGMMQKIFSQELRFKNDSGYEFPEWEEVELKKIASKVNTKNRDNSVSTVLTNSATQGIVSQESYFEREIVTESNLTGYYVVRIGDFVYNPRISSTAPVGPIKMNELTQGIMSPLYTVFRFEKGLLKFYQYFFESSVWHDYMKSVANSGARHDRMNISGADFFGLPVPQPFEEEQTKIARFLSAIDDKITAKKAELDKLKSWKRGLLQQMFV
ncbi:TPA: restriction endonuclease subunit S [Klebsiella pneumoniae subsp. pneumoniae]|uniref:restriction endonuclease subunit S n=1 Tax=Enterobacteriaceae TaxID=543 RepID=UPI001033689D|nr:MULTISPECIES: restriction endonuclease subunit S [Enterobacteriaceae]MBC4299187.1 restriction endonuclease subunit S [Klebsiella pneumoniae]MBZ1560489.1 restriction endonuclease subunit S [Klebsiella pneumoniae]MDX7588294.1 restriction endonuclease subunit S [Enterobacter kobei]HDU6043753.1 restriction endonuclease subunit S [Klebsiella pneumoniae subsp. pneumoniae]